MALQVPNLDDKRFDELLEESIQLISRFSPEWTDYNIHDPGITFIELFAWLTETHIYQLNRVTDENREKFLKLVDITSRALTPARVRVQIDMQASTKGGLLKGGAQLKPIGYENIVYTNLTDVFLTVNSIMSISSQDGLSQIDHTEANFTADIFFEPFGDSTTQQHHLQIKFGSVFQESAFKLFFELYEQDLPKSPSENINDNFVTENHHADAIPSVILKWEYFSASGWQSLVKIEDETHALTQSGHISFKSPDRQNLKAGEFKVRCYIEQGRYEIAPWVLAIRLNAFSAAQIEVQPLLNLEPSTGIALQKIALNYSPIVEFDWQDDYVLASEIKDWDSFIMSLRMALNTDNSDLITQLAKVLYAINPSWIMQDLPSDRSTSDNIIFDILLAMNAYFGLTGVTYDDILNDKSLESHFNVRKLLIQVASESGHWQDWYRVENFYHSGSQDQHYILDMQAGIITFGNGLNGKIPAKKRAIRAYNVKTSLGAEGNLNKGQKWLINDTHFHNVIADNWQAGQPGLSVEALESAELRARRDYNQQYRLVTSEDFENISLRTPGLRVSRAKAMVNHDPSYPCVSIPGRITLVILPYSRIANPPPVPSPEFLQTVQNYLENFRLITTQVYVIAPHYTQVSVRCRVRVKAKKDAASVIKQMTASLDQFLNPQTGGEEKQGWNFGRSVYLSEIYQILEAVEGVEYTTHLCLEAAGDEPLNPLAKCTEIKLPPRGLVYPGIHQIQNITRNA